MRGSWIQTYTGTAFYPLDPRPEDIHIEDIAHSLAHQCRFAGHTIDHYSVAEHSCYVARLVPPEMRLVALLHDAAEAYVMDLPRPIKEMLPEYRHMEDQVWSAIAKRFDLPLVMPQEVKYVDNAMLATEGRQALNPPGAKAWTAKLPPPAPVRLRFWFPEVAERRFLSAFQEYST